MENQSLILGIGVTVPIFFFLLEEKKKIKFPQFLVSI